MSCFDLSGVCEVSLFASRVGKTAAFLLPIIHKLLEEGVQSHKNQRPQEPEVVVIAPTRELVIQIKDEARKFAMGSGVNR